MGGQHREITDRQLTGVRIGLAQHGVQDHALDAQIAKFRATDRWQAILRTIAKELDVALRGQRGNAFADSAFATETRLAFEGFGQLVGGVAASLRSLFKRICRMASRLRRRSASSRSL